MLCRNKRIKYELKDLFFGTGTELGRGTALLGTSTTASRLWDERDLGLLEEVVGQNDENRSNPTMKLRVDLSENRSDLSRRKVRRQLANSFNIVEVLGAAIAGPSCRDNLDRGPRVVADHLDTSPWIGVTIPLGKEF